MKFVYVATLIVAGLDMSFFGGAVMAEVSAEFEEHLRAVWQRIRS